MKWLVEIVKDENGAIVDRVILSRTSRKALPSGTGKEYLLLEGPSTKYPVVVENEGVYTVEAGVTAASLKDAFYADTYTKMAEVFGTNNSDSATAYNETWKDMLTRPASYSVLGLTARLTRGTFSAGDILDTDQKITDYASACIDEVDAYALWRMSRIETYKSDLAAL